MCLASSWDSGIIWIPALIWGMYIHLHTFDDDIQEMQLGKTSINKQDLLKLSKENIYI